MVGSIEEPVISRRNVIRAFKVRGLTLQATALDGMMSVLAQEQTSAQHVLKAIVEELVDRTVASSQKVITKTLLATVVADMSRNAKDVNDEALQLLDAFETPRLQYDTTRKQFTLMTEGKEKRSLFGAPEDKVDMFAQRFALIQQRILRQDLFRPKLISSNGRGASTDDRNVTHSITPLESMLGRHGVRFLLGMIVQVDEGNYFLEDASAQVPLFLDDAMVLTDGFITENCIVLVEGEMVDGVLHVHRIGNPIIEDRAESLDSIGLQQTDIFGCMSTIAQLEDIREQEQEHDGMFVILSDLHLDKIGVMERLEFMLGKYQEIDGDLPVFVFMGNFATSSDPKTVIGYLDELANMIGNMPRLAKEGKFVFVPGPRDPGMGLVLPRPPLPNYCTQGLRSKLQHVKFASNPCRIRYFSKELVFFRQDTLQTLRRNCILKPRTGSDWAQHTVKTLLDQGHLSPLPTPIYWQYDHALRLYPLPDAVILGDRVDQFFENYSSCDCINPGPFSNDFSFVVYRPIADVDKDGTTKSDVEFSAVPDEVSKEGATA